MTCSSSLRSENSWCRETYHLVESAETIIRSIKVALPCIEGLLDEQSCSGWMSKVKLLPQKSCRLCSGWFRRFFVGKCACYQEAYLKPEDIDGILPTLKEEFGAVVLGLALQQAKKEDRHHIDLPDFIWYLTKLCFRHQERMSCLTQACYQLAEEYQEVDWPSIEAEALYVLSVCSGYEEGGALLQRCCELSKKLLAPNGFGCRGYLQDANWCALDFRQPLDQKTLVGALNLIYSYLPQES